MPVKQHLLTALLMLLVSSPPLLAESAIETREQIASIQSMGQLYGIALPCNYLQQTRRIKTAMVAALPKKRYLEQAFEEATNASFLKFHEAGGQCPVEATLATEIDTAITVLNSAFKS